MADKLNRTSWFDADLDFNFKVPATSRVGKKRENCSRKPINNKPDFKLWSEKHKPARVEDLVVQKKKIEELRHWIRESFKLPTRGPEILILSGPSGCGKTCTLHLLCQELGVEVSQWEEPIRYNSAVEWEFSSGLDRGERVPDLNPLAHFNEFISRSSRYGNLPFKNEEKSCSTCEKKIIVIKEIPNMARNNIDVWHAILRQYKTKGTIPLVFITTEEIGNSVSTRNLFPTYLMEDLAIKTLSFNSVANTFLTKAVQQVLSLERKSLPADCSLASLVESSNGDLRSALNALQLILMPQLQSNIKSHVGNAKGSKRKKKDDNSEAATNCKDPNLNLLHALGKVLYRKRTSEPLPSQDLPAHLSQEKRLPLQEDPDILAERIREPGSKVSLFLHQNYLHFYRRIEDVSRAADYLGSADCFSRDFLDDYSLLVSVRGVMHCNTDLVTGKWRPLNKPAWNGSVQKMQTYQMNCRRFWPELSVYPTEFYTSYLPYFRKMGKNLELNQDKRKFVESVGVFGKWQQLDNSAVNEDDEEDQPSLSLVPPNREPLIKNPPVTEDTEEEILIEEYDD